MILTPRETACLCFITAFGEIEGEGPSNSEIARCLQLRHRNSAHRIVTKLRRMGLLDRAGKRIKGSREGGLRVVVPHTEQSFHKAQAQQ